MKTYNSVEEYADHVGTITARALAAMCLRLGPEHPATVAIENLCTESANIVQQSRMRQERAGGYDLDALRVDVTSASNSETGFEREQ
jgi:hypothetical protein